MQNGRITKVLSTTEEERGVSLHVNRLDDALSALREKLRHGQRLTVADDRPLDAQGGSMRLAICAGPATTGKTSVLRHMHAEAAGAPIIAWRS